MNQLAVIGGYLMLIALGVAVIAAGVGFVTERIITVRQLKVNHAIEQYRQYVGQRLHGDAFWFSEDMPTCQLLRLVADNVSRGVPMNPDATRHQWRGWRKG